MLDISKNSICLFNLFIMFLTVLFEQFKLFQSRTLLTARKKSKKEIVYYVFLIDCIS